MTGRLPAFIVGGAPRCATTWFTTELDRHPEIWVAKPLRPEPKFFLVDELYAHGIDAYSREWFDDAPDDVVVGEKSTNYLESAVAARRIAHDLPGVRLIFILRDPVTRAISNYRWSVMNGMEDADFDTALRLEVERDQHVGDNLRYARPHAYFSRGCYADLLEPYLALIPRDRVLCLRYEDLVADPRSSLEEAYQFLGVSPESAPPPRSEIVNASSNQDISYETVARLHAAYAAHNHRLGELLGQNFRVWEPPVHL